MLGRRRRVNLEGSIEIKDPSTKWQLCLKIKRTSDGLYRKAFGLEFVKRAAGMSGRLRKVRDWTLWRSRTPLEGEIRNWTLWRVGPLQNRRRAYSQL
jgi:hypothetical protein